MLPSVATPERFRDGFASAHLLRAMLRSWPLHEQRTFYEDDLGIPLVLEEESGKLFRDRYATAMCARRAGHVRGASKGVDLRFGTTVTNVSRAASGFAVETSGGTIECDRVVLATGGLSVPATGSDGIGLRLAQSFGHDLVDTYPALAPLLTSGDRHAALSGVSLDVRLRSKDGSQPIETHGGFLFTHRGYSGPSVLDISHVTAQGRSRPRSACSGRRVDERRTCMAGAVTRWR